MKKYFTKRMLHNGDILTNRLGDVNVWKGNGLDGCMFETHCHALSKGRGYSDDLLSHELTDNLKGVDGLKMFDIVSIERQGIVTQL